MIVTCTSCKTRFRVSDEKVGPKGARVRCSRCGATFVVAPGGAGGVCEDPAAPAWPELEQPPPLPARRAHAAPAQPGPPPADPFAPPAAPAADPFAAVLSAPAGTPVDPFAIREPTAGETREAGPGSGADWDPFGVLEAAPPEASPAPPGAASPARAKTDLTELLEDREPPGPPFDTGSLALEERDPSPPRAAAPRYDGSELDLGFEIAGGADPLPGLDPFDAVAAPSALAPDSTALDREPPRIVAPPVDVLAPASAGGPERAPAPSAPAPPSAERGPPAAPPAEARSGRTAALANSLSLALLVALAVALFLGWRSGLVGRVSGAWGRSAPPPLVEPAAVRGGLYDTAEGTPVLVVRGMVDARAAVAGPVRVRVELLDGARVVATATGLAGAAATAEQVFAAGTIEEAAALRRSLDARAAPVLAAGASAPFLVVFPPPAPDPHGLRMHALAEPAPAAAGGG